MKILKLWITAVAGAIVMITKAQAAEYPTGPITIQVGFGPGSSTEFVGRVLKPEVEKILGNTILIVPHAGNAGATAALEVSRAAPDGYMLTFGAEGMYAGDEHELPYDPKAAFTAIAKLGEFRGRVLVTPPNIGSLAELIATGRHNPPLLYAKVNLGGNVCLRKFGDKFGVAVQGAGYRSESIATIDLMAGRISTMCALPAPVVPLVQAGKLRALATTGAARNPDLPNVPTLKDLDVEIVQTEGCFNPSVTLLGPPGLPADIVDKLADAFRRAVGNPALGPQLDKLAFVPGWLGPAEARKFINARVACLDASK